MKTQSIKRRGWITIAMLLLLSLCLASCSLPFLGGGETAEATDEITEATGEATTEKVKKPINIKDQSTSTYEPETIAPAPTDTNEPTDTNAPTDTTEPYVPQPGAGERLPWADGSKE